MNFCISCIINISTLFSQDPHCQLNKHIPNKGMVVKPIISKGFNYRAQMDLMDFQSVDHKGDYNWTGESKNDLSQLFWILQETKKISCRLAHWDFFLLFVDKQHFYCSLQPYVVSFLPSCPLPPLWEKQLVDLSRFSAFWYKLLKKLVENAWNSMIYKKWVIPTSLYRTHGHF